MDAALGTELEETLGVAVVGTRALSGGDINDAYAVTLADGRELFVKTNRAAPAGMFEAEARGLAWLAAPGVIRLPAVVAATDRALVLELIRPGRRAPTFDEALGRALAELHRAAPGGFGLDHDNFIGRLSQSNRGDGVTRWSEFYRRERLEPQLKLATDGGLATPKLRGGFARLFARLHDLAGPEERPARLHGDLWGGNLMCDERGAPCLIDPAVYGGHREIDLAMMRLFGGFGTRVFAAYEEAAPLGPGHRERVGLHQLYPLLVHVNLFGGGYVASVESLLAALV